MMPFSLDVGGQQLFIEKPIVMGILNITPDSFYDGGKHVTLFLEHTEKMLNEGATIIDIGAMTSKPGSLISTATSELERLLPIVKKIKLEFPSAILSIDTVHSLVAKECIELGASIINDISAGEIDDAMIDVVAHYGVPYVCMHMKGLPENMHIQPVYEDLLSEMINYFENRIRLVSQRGVKQIILDPGFGFGKNIQQNYELLASLKEFQVFKLPLLVGLSRKSMIWKILQTNPDNALNGTTVLNTIALQNGAQILRVHDVKEAVQAIKLYELLPK